MRAWSRGRVGGSLRCGRQNVVAHGGVAVATDVRAVDGGEVAVRLGRREQAAAEMAEIALERCNAYRCAEGRRFSGIARIALGVVA